MAPDDADVIVAGAGAVGRAVAWQVASGGLSVTVLEQRPVDAFTRSARGTAGPRPGAVLAFDHPDPAYSRLAMRAETWWRVVERLTGASLLRMTGSLRIGMPGSAGWAAALAAVRRLGLEHEVLEADQVSLDYPHLRLEPGRVALRQSGAGVVDAAAPERLLDLSREEGVRFRFSVCVEDVRAADGFLEISAAGEPLRCRHLVLAIGRWAAGRSSLQARVRASCSLPPVRLHPARCRRLDLEGSPVPALDEGPLLYLHGDGPIGRPHEAPDAARRPEPMCVEPRPGSGSWVSAGGGPDRAGEAARRFAALVPAFAPARIRGRSSCRWAAADDGGFVIDWLDPAHRVLLVCAGGSGGPALAPVLGRAAAELVEGGTDLEISGMTADRS